LFLGALLTAVVDDIKVCGNKIKTTFFLHRSPPFTFPHLPSSPRSNSSLFSLCHHPPPFMFNGLLFDWSSPLIRSSAFGVGLIPPPPYGILVLHKGSQFALLHPLATTTLESFGRRYVLYSSARHPLQQLTLCAILLP
jgi:hypothetical protein